MKEKIKNKIRSYPIIYIETKEEKRALALLKEIASDLNINSLQLFSITSGIIDIVKNKNANIFDPVEFLKSIQSENDNEKIIFVFPDPENFFSDPLFVRILKDSVNFLCGKKRLVFIGNFALPQNISHLIEKIKLPLPEKSEYEKIIKDFDPETKDKDKVIEALAGMTTDEAANTIAEGIASKGKIDSQYIMDEKCKRLSREALKVEKPVDEKSIGGLENLINFLKIRKSAFSKKAQEFGLPKLKGILIVGLPGCGKSLTAKASSQILGVPLVRLDVGALMGSLVGESEKHTRDAIEIAEAMAPCVLWIDELDKQLSAGSNGQDTHEVTKRVMSSILTWLQEKDKNVFIVATANNITAISRSFPELLRKGRFDEIFFVDLPNEKEREEIFKIHISKFRKPEKFNISLFAKKSEDFTGAEIESAIKDAMFMAFDDGKDLENEYILEAIEKIIPQFRNNSTAKEIKEFCKSIAKPASKEKENNNSNSRQIL